MDVRVKTFASEAALRLGFLRAEHGFTAQNSTTTTSASTH
jgi:hypothetical protein